MTRPETTNFLRNVLMNTKLVEKGYYASEVSIDAMTTHKKRVDFLQFIPAGAVFLSDIEKGIFICYEVKSCVQDVYSGNGLNFYGEKNFIVTTMETYKKIQHDWQDNKMNNHIRKTNPESSLYYGIMVAIPDGRTITQEYEEPTPLTGDEDFRKWHLQAIIQCRLGSRKRSTTELLFCMLRSGK